MEINDQEYILLTDLKKQSKEEYYKAIHIAHFCDRIGKTLQLDADALKLAAYYHRIGVLCEENTWEKVSELAQIHSFPPVAYEGHLSGANISGLFERSCTPPGIRFFA